MDHFARLRLTIIALLFPTLVWADFSQTASDHYKRGMSAFEKRNIDQALTEFTEVIRLDPKNTVAYLMRGTAYGTKQELDRAIADFDKAIQLNSSTQKGKCGHAALAV